MKSMNDEGGRGASLRLGGIALGVAIGLALGGAPPAVAAPANPAIANTPPCNSNKVVFMPLAGDDAKALAFVKKLPGVGGIEKVSSGAYNASFASPAAVNALIADLNKNRAREVISTFQYFQCKYKLF